MLVSVYTAARHLCEKSGNTLTDLELYRLLYVAQMTHLGLYNSPIFEETFEAWEFGPVQPDLYHQINSNGESELKKALRAAQKITPGSEKDILDQTYDQARQINGDGLVAVTHWDKGAWAKAYDEDDPHSVIRLEHMRQEYLDRIASDHRNSLHNSD